MSVPCCDKYDEEIGGSVLAAGGMDNESLADLAAACNRFRKCWRVAYWWGVEKAAGPEKCTITYARATLSKTTIITLLIRRITRRR